MRWILPILIILGIGAGIIFSNIEKVNIPSQLKSNMLSRITGAQSKPTPYDQKTLVPKNRKQYLLTFAAQDGSRLHAETRELSRPRTLRESVRLVLEELIRGSRTGLVQTLPRTSKILEVFLDGQGTVYVDFSKEISTEHPGGVWTESITVASVVQTLTANFQSIRRVAFLVGGKTQETLAGHIDIRRPVSRFDARLLHSVSDP